MISAILYRGKEGLTGCRMTGHSGQAEAGRDIVCAAASILGCTCVNALETFAGILPAVRMNDGFLAVRLPEDCQDHDAQVLLHGLLQGLRDIEKQYPHHVRLIVQPVH